jgi:hypothetical protein
MDETIIIIQTYFDGELEKSSEPHLFNLLAQDEEARNYFRQLSELKKSVNSAVEEFPYELEERILSSLITENKNSVFSFFRTNLIPAFSLVVVIVLFVLVYIFSVELRDYKSRVEIITNVVKTQNETIELLINSSLPPVEVQAGWENEIIIKTNL